LEQLKTLFNEYIFDVFGLKDELAGSGNGDGEILDGLMQLIIELRAQARANKDWATSDQIRDALKELEIQLKDGKEGTEWMKV
jgi:cysteinyl-tRNA synthetase